jgi:hypothetical protein
MDDEALTPHDVATELAEAPAVVIEAPNTEAADTARAIHEAVEESEEARWRGEVLQTLSRMETRQQTLHERMEQLVTSPLPSTTAPEREEAAEASMPSSESAEETATAILEPPPAVAAERAERARRKRRLSHKLR